jgi:2-polyprenyl-3-methyl-5-hydroxy-6-metoxy-1,4-benzoquinol methylase
MDDPALAPDAQAGALQALTTINFISNSAGILWRPIRKLATGQQPLTLLDVATGAGDVPIRLWHKARQAGIDLRIAGCDISPGAVQHATERARQAAADVRCFACDVLHEPLPEQYDVVTCSLFLHHLDDAQAVELLRRMAAAARRLVLVNDLRRSHAGYLLAWLGTRLLTRSPVAQVDGPLSVRAAFTIPEVRELARQAGLADATVQRRWPCRLLLSWERPE